MSGLVAFLCNDPILGFMQIDVPAEPGVLDDRARLAFTAGHCHSLAVAVHELTGLPIVVVTSPGGEVWHMGVRDGDQFVDIRGRRPCTAQAIMDDDRDGWRLREITVSDVVQAAEAGESYPLQLEQARSFARALCVRENVATGG